MSSKLTATIKNIVKGDVETMKYELTEEKIEHANRSGKVVATLYRIRALRDIPRHGVKKGDLGGFIISPKKNSDGTLSWVLDQEGDAWVDGNAKVMQDAFVSDNALVTDNSVIQGTAKIRREAKIEGLTIVQNNNVVEGHARVKNSYLAGNNIMVGGYAEISKSTIPDRAMIFDDSKVMNTNQVLVCLTPRPMTFTLNGKGEVRINCGKAVHKNVESLLLANGADGNPLFGEDWQKEQIKANLMAFAAYSRR